MSHRRKIASMLLASVVVWLVTSFSTTVALAAPVREDFVVYTVRSGDTLNAIARRYGLTSAKLARSNSIKNPNLIYRGQKLLIPLHLANNTSALSQNKLSSKGLTVTTSVP